jgi:hypothetical protein
MIEKKALNKLHEKLHLIKRPNKPQKLPEQKPNPLKKNSTTLEKIDFPKPRTNFFAPINEFISLGTNNLNVSKLYECKLLPSQFLSTSTKIIGRLTREIYFSKKKSKSFSIKALDERCKPDFKMTRKRKKLAEKEQSKSLALLNKSCDQLVRENQRTLKYFVKKNRILEKETKSTQNLMESLKKLGNDEENKEFEEKLKECHLMLAKLDRIHAKTKT